MNRLIKTAPASQAVEYYPHRFTWNFWDKGEYMGFPTDEVDQKWSDLYNCKNTSLIHYQLLTVNSRDIWNSNHSSKSLD
jgi:hypothetical protein